MKTKCIFLMTLCAFVCMLGYSQRNIPLSTEFPIKGGGERASTVAPTAMIYGTRLTFSFPESAASQILIISQESNQIVYTEAFTSFTQVQIELSEAGLTSGNYWLHVYVYDYWWWGEFELEEDDMNKVATPLFSIDVKNVVSMYCDEAAETFYLYTQAPKEFYGTKYVVSREGEILSVEDSVKATWACWEDGVLYTHGETDLFFLDQKGDTVLDMNEIGPNLYTRLRHAKSMFCKDGVFYYWYGPVYRSCMGQGIYSYKDGGKIEKKMVITTYMGNGLVRMDNVVLCTGYGYHSVKDACYTMYFLDESTEWVPQEPKEIPCLKAPVGLSLVGDTFYIWSNDTQTMYTIPKSFFMGAVGAETTGVQTPVMEADMESSGYYDLQGRPVDSTQKGILLHNGKKVLVK